MLFPNLQAELLASATLAAGEAWQLDMVILEDG